MRNAIKTSISVIVLVLIVESLARVFAHDELLSYFSQGFHPNVGFNELEDAIEVRRLPARNIWPQKFPKNKSINSRRIIFIGSSVTRGEENANYPKFIEEELNESSNRDHNTYEIINLSASGYGIRRKYALFLKAVEFKPDLIVVHLDGSNEYEDERDYAISKKYEGNFDPTNWPMKISHFRFISQRRTEKLVWRYIPKNARKNTIVNDAEIELDSIADASIKKKWRSRLNDWLTKMVKKSKENNLKIIFLIRATYDRESTFKSGHIAPPGLEDGLARYLYTIANNYQDSDVRVIRIGKILSGLSSDINQIDRLFIDTSHFTKAGNKVLAKNLAKYIESGV